MKFHKWNNDSSEEKKSLFKCSKICLDFWQRASEYTWHKSGPEFSQLFWWSVSTMDRDAVTTVWPLGPHPNTQTKRKHWKGSKAARGPFVKDVFKVGGIVYMVWIQQQGLVRGSMSEISADYNNSPSAHNKNMQSHHNNSWSTRKLLSTMCCIIKGLPTVFLNPQQALILNISRGL